MNNFREIHYFQLPSQGNVYTITELQLANGAKKLLIATLKRDIFCLEYPENGTDYLVPTIKEVSFTYIPSGAEIISIDAFNKSTTRNEFVVGITIVKNSNDLDSLETFLNIYSEWEETDDFNIENIAQNCLNVQLNYMPYKLLHTEFVTWHNDKMQKEIVFLLSGSDHQVHVYREHTSDHVYKEIDNKEYFPEFTKTASPIIWMDIFYTKNYNYRITAIGCECGYVKLTKACTRTNKLIFNFSTKFSCYISNVRIYQVDKKRTNNFPTKLFNIERCNENENDPNLNLVVLNSILPGMIFKDVLKYGLSNYSTLPRHENGTSVFTCCDVADVDFDGEKEIIVGSSAEEIMLLKNKENGWYLEEMKKIAAPILGLKYIDISGDGVNELVIFSMKGVHVLQHDPLEIQRTLDKKIENLKIPQIEELNI